MLCRLSSYQIVSRGGITLGGLWGGHLGEDHSGPGCAGKDRLLKIALRECAFEGGGGLEILLHASRDLVVHRNLRGQPRDSACGTTAVQWMSDGARLMVNAWQTLFDENRLTWPKKPRGRRFFETRVADCHLKGRRDACGSKPRPEEGDAAAFTMEHGHNARGREIWRPKSPEFPFSLCLPTWAFD